jgi:hypothetical protein
MVRTTTHFVASEEIEERYGLMDPIRNWDTCAAFLRKKKNAASIRCRPGNAAAERINDKKRKSPSAPGRQEIQHLRLPRETTS